MNDISRSRSRQSRVVSATSSRSRRDTGSPVVVLLDLLLVVGVGVLAAWPFGDAYAGQRWLVAVVGGLLLGALVALAGHALRLGPWSMALLLALGYLVIGPGLAVPDLATSGIGPNATAIRALLHGVVEAWRDSLTAPVPLGRSGALLVVPLVSAMVAGVLAAVLLWRSRWPAAAGLALAALFVTAAAFGDVNTHHAIVRGLALGVALVVWFRLRALRHVQARWVRRALMTSVVVAIAGGVALAAAPAMTSHAERRVLRDYVEPPFNPQDYPSPLSKYRKYVNSDAAKAKPMFSVEGLGKGALVRLATMDYYDGIVWNVAGGPDAASDSGTFRRLRADARAHRGSQKVSVTVLDPDYHDPWVPTVGQTDTIEIAGQPSAAEGGLVYNRETGTMASTTMVRPETTFVMHSQITPQPSREAITGSDADHSVGLPAPKLVPDELVARVKEWQGNDEFTGGAEGAWLLFLADAFKNKGFFSDGDGNVPAGHGFSRLQLLTKTGTQPIGDDEQYAAAMALAAQAMRNLPARVVIGFRTPADSTAAAVTVAGRDMAAWVEVKLADQGWVAFDPTPPDKQILQRPKEDPNDDPQPQVLQPPQTPGEPKEAGANLQQGDGKKSKFDLWGLVGSIAAVALTVGKVALLTSPLWGILLIKLIRRRRRRRATDLTTRLSGAWKEVADRARDLGVKLPYSNTRQENGALLDSRLAGGGSVALASRADAHVFGPDEPDEAEVSAYWADVRTAVKRMRRSQPLWRRPLAWFSPASIPWSQVRRRALGRLRAVASMPSHVAGRLFRRRKKS
ncbi:Transglutaminase-like superfamily protein [Nocardioides terrae]|uniref:Transglutaminase-like superfamily protein n=1 Tax=Nocardioides terrae TaxID=574651 RepID=A0A1I1MJ49_9ACTN|nr:transglutaminase domain-containing protein [Nocardioides terrae]SFC85401.1 Transglutaminase-like superfamily protein [Nocardioides terrae]